MSSGIFRKDALNSISTPEQLDKHIKIMKPSTWVLYIALIITFIFLTIWSFTYNITNNVSANGVVFTNANVINIYAENNAIVKDVLVESRDHVNAGDIIAVVSRDDILERIEELKYQLNLTAAASDEYKNLNERIDSLIDQYVSSTVIKSGCSGFVQSVKSMGNSIEAGDTIASVISDDGYNELVMFVPLDTAKTLSLGMETQISPVYASREEYGYMTGVITSVDAIPITEESIIKHMGTLSYVEDILPKSAAVEVRVKLDIDSSSENQYKWSNEKGRSLKIELGTQCNVIIVSDEFKPIEFLIGK